MKRYILIGIGILIVSSIVWMGFRSVNALNEKKRKEKNAVALSSILSSLKVDATTSGSTMLVYFNSECEHCQWEVKHLSENIEAFSGVNLAFVSLEPKDSARQFLKKFSLQDYFLETSPEDVMKTFSGGVPQIFIYEENTLKEKFDGEVKVELLINALTQE